MYALNIIKCGWWTCAAWRASEGQAASRADIVSFGLRLGGRVGGRADALAIRRASAERMDGRAGERAGGRVDGRASSRAGRRVGGAVGRNILIYDKWLSSKFVIISMADGLKWRGELRCFLIP